MEKVKYFLDVVRVDGNGMKPVLQVEGNCPVASLRQVP
jgi:hypothetical protein